MTLLTLLPLAGVLYSVCSKIKLAQLKTVSESRHERPLKVLEEYATSVKESSFVQSLFHCDPTHQVEAHTACVSMTFILQHKSYIFLKISTKSNCISIYLLSL